MPFLPPKGVPIPHFLAEVYFIGIAVSVDPATGRPTSFAPTGLIQGDTPGIGRVTMTTSVDTEVQVRLVSLNPEVSLVPTVVKVSPGNFDSETFEIRAPNISAKVTVIALYDGFFGASTAAMTIDCLEIK